MKEPSRKELFSIAYVKALGAPLGFNPGAFEIDDDSVDIIFTSKEFPNAKVRNPLIKLQLKCTAKTPKKGILDFSLKKKNYDDLRGTNVSNPTYLVVVTVPDQVVDWVQIAPNDIVLRYQAYWYSLANAGPTSNKSSVKLAIPCSQRFDLASFQDLMNLASQGLTK